MKLYVVILLFWFSFLGMFAQERKVDSLRNQLQFEKHVGLSNDKLDSVQATFYQKSDSLKNLYKSKFNALDSSRSKLKIRLDSLIAFQSVLKKLRSGNKIDSAETRFANRIDNLKLQGQISKITHAHDSINILCDSTVAQLNQNLQTLKDQTVGKLGGINLPPRLAAEVTQMKEGISRFKIPASNLNIAPLDVSNTGSIGKLDNLNLQSIGQGVENLSALENLKEGFNVAEISDITGKAGEYTKDIQQLTKGNLSEVNELSNIAEAKAEQLSGLNDIKDQTQVFDEYKDMAGKIQNPDSVKELAVEKMKQVAVNHFAEKEQVLKEAMETVSKYKSKYGSIESISEITKRPPNEMDGKPFIERMIPGVGIQVQRKGDDILIDFNPYAGYRFTKRITIGAGWNQRMAYNVDKTKFNPDAIIFGPRAYGEVKLWGGFSPRVELEVMNTNIPLLTRTPSLDPAKREWIWGAFVGMKKEYKFIKNVRGTALVMMRLFNPENKSPYADVLNVRFGFEFPMKKKVNRDE